MKIFVLSGHWTVTLREMKGRLFATWSPEERRLPCGASVGGVTGFLRVPVHWLIWMIS